MQDWAAPLQKIAKMQDDTQIVHLILVNVILTADQNQNETVSF